MHKFPQATGQLETNQLYKSIYSWFHGMNYTQTD